MRTYIQVLFAGSMVTMMIASPIVYKRWQDSQWRNFRVVEAGVLYRSGQMSPERLKEVVSLHGIRTIVCLRDGDAAADKAEEGWAAAMGLNFVRIPYRSWWPDPETGKVPADVSVQEFRDVMNDPAKLPVLVHCFAGIHRTGSMCAVFRMDYQGWSNQAAMSEMRAMGYTVLTDHEDIHAYMEKYKSPTPGSKTIRVPILPVSRQKDANP